MRMATLVHHQPNGPSRWAMQRRWNPLWAFGGVRVDVPRVQDSADALTITCDLPGVDREDLDLTLAAGQLTIVGRREDRTYRASVFVGQAIDEAQLAAALAAAGFRIDESTAGLYLWATRGEDAWATVAALAAQGILVAPGTFYGDRAHVRVALTASDDDIAEAAARLRA